MRSFESKLPQIFSDMGEAYRNIQARLQAEQFKVNAKAQTNALASF